MELFNRNTFRRIPFTTIILLISLLLSYAFEWAIHAIGDSGHIGILLAISQSAVRNGHFLRFATASFFHMNFGHFLSNAIGLLFYLSILEYVAGSCRAAYVVLASALGGAVGSVLFHWVQFMVGASTILFGVFGALGAIIIIYRRDWGRYFKLVFGIWLITLVCLALVGYISLNVVDQGAHIGGLIAGTLITIVLTRGRSLRELQNPAGKGMKIGLIPMILLFGISFYQEVITLWPLIHI